MKIIKHHIYWLNKPIVVIGYHIMWPEFQQGTISVKIFAKLQLKTFKNSFVCIQYP